MEQRSINSLHRSKLGKVSNKWESYLTYYDSLFSCWQDHPVSLLEIGVQHGGSLDTWAAFFTAGQCFVGCDIDIKCAALAYNDPRISVIVGDINSSEAFQEIRSISPAFDIILDDGSHLSADILTSFVNYFPLVKPGGLYIIEDTHSLYLDLYGGGILHDGGAYSFFKKLVDVIGFQFWQDQLSISTYLRTFFPLQSTPDFIIDGWIESIEFRNSIIKIEKSLTPGHEKLGMAIVSGLNRLE